ncbi:MAG TPA: hypothetical protein VHU23_13130 [Rhizomicrobium sp.]|jgi:hypothetical protein|nr:hypothetical protein [Rhizomicrobium sp.]
MQDGLSLRQGKTQGTRKSFSPPESGVSSRYVDRPGWPDATQIIAVSGGERFDGFERSARLDGGCRKIMLRLKVHPEVGACSEHSGQPEGSSGTCN